MCGPREASNSHLRLVMTVFNHQAKGFLCILSSSLNFCLRPDHPSSRLSHLRAFLLSFFDVYFSFLDSTASV